MRIFSTKTVITIILGLLAAIGVSAPATAGPLEDIAAQYMAATVTAQQSACTKPPATLADAASCELWRLSVVNKDDRDPLPVLSIMPALLPIHIGAVPGQPVCEFRHEGGAQYCGGTIVLSDSGFGELGKNQLVVSLIIQHEYTHSIHKQLNDQLKQGIDGEYRSEQYADFGIGVQQRKQLDAGLVTRDQVEETLRLIPRHLGNDHDAGHGTKAERLAAVEAGLAGDWGYLNTPGAQRSKIPH